MPQTDRAIAVVCNRTGSIEEILMDTRGNLRAGQSLLELAAASREQTLELIAATGRGAAGATIEVEGDVLHVQAASVENEILVIGGTTSRLVEDVCAGISRQHDRLRPACAAILANVTAPAALNSTLWNEISLLNNNLATAQRELARSNSHLRWLNEQKNQLLGMAAHDLRNPLAAILAYCEFIAEDATSLTDDQAMLLDRIRLNTDFMLTIIDDVLDLSAVEHGIVNLSREEIDIAAVATEIVSICRPMAAKKEIALSVRVVTPAMLFADRSKIMQVLQNLVSNAVKFSTLGTEVVLETASDENNVTIEVRDQGQGIPADDLQRLFQPFSKLSVQATAGEKSTGLGLAIVKRLVEAHGGTISVASIVGAGTTFRIVLPRHFTAAHP